MTLLEIHDMSADALAGEELQFLRRNQWCVVDNSVHLFCYIHEWRIKPTIEVNGVMMTKRQAKAAWDASGATSYSFELAGSWRPSHDKQPDFTGTKYRWETPKWIYVNGEKIVRVGWSASCYGHGVGSESDKDTLTAAIHKLIEIK